MEPPRGAGISTTYCSCITKVVNLGQVRMHPGMSGRALRRRPRGGAPALRAQRRVVRRLRGRPARRRPLPGPERDGHATAGQLRRPLLGTRPAGRLVHRRRALKRATPLTAASGHRGVRRAGTSMPRVCASTLFRQSIAPAPRRRHA
jgi:hypothetical protein